MGMCDPSNPCPDCRKFYERTGESKSKPTIGKKPSKLMDRLRSAKNRKVK